MGAGLYDADPDRWIWPYHYHYGVEEWLYVIDGAPVLRDPHGERTLAPGDFVCFPTGPAGAHGVGGPGRMLLLSEGGWPGVSVAVYPDSDKVGPRPGDTGVPGLDNLDFRRQDAVDYWYGEGGDEPVASREVVRPPRSDHRQPVVNAERVELEPFAPEETPEGFRCSRARLGPLLGAERLGATLWVLGPGQGGAPYHCEHGREEWLLVLSGAPTLRHPEGEDRLAPGDVVCCREGPAGAHRLLSTGTSEARAVIISTMGLPYAVEYPDSGKLMVKYSREREAAIFRLGDAVGYWDDEPQ
jgi:uncharacterized cupin superfamily protein